MEEEVTQIQSPPSYQSTVRPGTVLGNYRAERLIGVGLSSEVYEGVNLVAQKRCALKVFHHQLELNPVPYGRYVHEAAEVDRLANPSIAAIYSPQKVDGRTFMAMELVEGRSLGALVREHAPLSRRVILPIIRRLCEALAQVHAYNLHHLHLHDGQVIVVGGAGDPQVKLLDFGVHHLLPLVGGEAGAWQRGPQHAVCLTPEQVKGQPGDQRSDVYALCILLYEMVTGRVPFFGDTFAATAELQLNEPPRAPGEITPVSPELEQTILRGLEKDPRRRIPSVEALLAALDPLAMTGKHQLVPRTTVTGRHAGLTPSPSREHALAPATAPGERAARQASPDPPAAQALPSVPEALSPGRQPPLVAPQARPWLLIVLAVVAVLFAAAVVYVLMGD